MKLHNYERASDYEVEKWIEESIELTPYQKDKLIKEEIVRFSPFEFMKRRKKVNSFWLRLTVFIIPFVWILLVISLPFNFLITGKWGYDYEKIKWYDKWIYSIGL